MNSQQQVAVDWSDALRAEDACAEALAFAARFDTFQAAWDACERGDWLLWWIGRTLKIAPMSPERRPLVRVACGCARLALKHVRMGENRPRLAIELVERWANGDDSVTLEQMRSAVAAAAAVAVYASAAVYAAAAVSAAAAASAASAVSAAAAASAERAKVLKEYADLVRREYPHPPTKETR